MLSRVTLATWAAITALVVVVFCVVALPDPAGWAAGYLRRWEIALPVAVLAPMLISLIWVTIKASGKIEYLETEFYDPLAWLRIGVWLDQVFLHPWQWATSSLHPIPEPPYTELHRFQIGLTHLHGIRGVGIHAVRPDAARQRLPHNRVQSSPALTPARAAAAFRRQAPGPTGSGALSGGGRHSRLGACSSPQHRRCWRPWTAGLRGGPKRSASKTWPRSARRG